MTTPEKISPPVERRFCSRCQGWKNAEGFVKVRSSSGTLMWRCPACAQAQKTKKQMSIADRDAFGKRVSAQNKQEASDRLRHKRNPNLPHDMFKS